MTSLIVESRKTKFIESEKRLVADRDRGRGGGKWVKRSKGRASPVAQQ